ncbi:MAG: hypothetical protein ACYC41_06485 [Bacillota bacterium]
MVMGYARECQVSRNGKGYRLGLLKDSPPNQYEVQVYLMDSDGKPIARTHTFYIAVEGKKSDSLMLRRAISAFTDSTDATDLGNSAFPADIEERKTAILAMCANIIEGKSDLRLSQADAQVLWSLDGN